MINKKPLLKLFLILIICLIGVDKVNAISMKATNGNTYNYTLEEGKSLAYDIEEIKFNLKNNTVTIKGWAIANHQNNWGGIYSTIGMAVAYEGSEPNTYKEVTYKERNLFGHHCERNSKFCNDWKTAGNNAEDDTLLSYEEKGNCIIGNISGFGCLYRKVGFEVELSLSGYLSENQSVNLYLMIGYTKSAAQQTGIYYPNETNKNLIENKENNNYSYNIYNGSKSKYAIRTKIGVDTTSCKVTNGGTASSSCSAGKLEDGSNYAFIIESLSKNLKRATDSNLYPIIKTQEGIFVGGDQVLMQNVPESYKYSDTELAVRQYFPSISKIKLYKISESSNGKMIGNWIPASWVTHTETLSFKIWKQATCEPKDKTNDLKCEKPEASFNIFEDNSDCIQTFTYINQDGSYYGRVNIKFTQKGIIKVGLHNTYIKSGQAFGLDATYTDIITWKIVDSSGKDCTNYNTCYKYSDNANSEQKKKIRKELQKQIKTYLTTSELFTTSPENAAKFYFYYDKDNKKEIEGTWSLSDNAKNYANKFVKNINDTSGSVTVKAIFELCKAYSNINDISSKGVKHKYVCDGSQLEEEYIYNGKVFYTDLDLESKYYKIKGTINGLNALDYVKYEDRDKNKYVWSVNYECGIECYQGYYNNPEDPSNPNNPSLGNGNGSGYAFYYREIDKLEPFPIVSGQNDIRAIDENWLSWAEAIGRTKGNTYDDYLETSAAEKAGLGFDGEKYTYEANTISKRLANAYEQDNLEYVVVINKDNIKSIKNYNINNNYFNTTFDYYSAKTYSNFLGSTTDSGKTNFFSHFYRKNTGSIIGQCGANDKNNSIGLYNCFCPLRDSENNCIYDGGHGLSEGDGS